MSNQKKVLIITPSLRMGGAEKHTVFLAKSLKEIGFDVMLIALFDGGVLEKELIDKHIPYLTCKTIYQKIRDLIPSHLIAILKTLLKWNKKSIESSSLREKEASFKLSKLQIVQRFELIEISKREFVEKSLKAFDPDIVHVHTWECKMCLKWANQFNIKKIIYTHHNILSVRHSNQEINSLNDYILFATHICFISSQQKEDFINNIENAANKRNLIITPISGFEAPSAILKDNFRTNNPVIGTMSNLAPIKGVVFLLDAIQKLQHKSINVKLIIGGGTSEWVNYFKTLASNMGIKNHVHFLGVINNNDQLHDFFKNIDIFALPSLSEGSPLVVIEAMSYGLPIIATSVGGIPNLIKDQEEGILIPPQNSLELARKIEFIIKDRDLRIKLSTKSFHKFSLYFSKTKIIEKYTELYLS